nr:class I SAM-dependent methyltransferase [Enorma massiliensis]
MEHEVADSREAWEANAVFWDAAMGDASNAFHRQTVRPGVTDLLDPQPGDFVLDVACGNGNYAAYLAERGVDVLAFDFSPRMIELARCRQERYADRIEFVVADATDVDSLCSLARARPFTKPFPIWQSWISRHSITSSMLCTACLSKTAYSFLRRSIHAL